MKLLVKLVKIAKSQNGDVNCKLEIHNDLYKYVKKCLKRDMENEISKIENKLYHFLIEDFSENFKFEYKGERYNYWNLPCVFEFNRDKATVRTQFMADILLKEITLNLKQYNDELDDLIFNLSETFDFHP